MDVMKAGWRVVLCCVVAMATLLAEAVRCDAEELSSKRDDTSNRQPGALVPATKENVAMMEPARPAAEKALKYLATRQQEDGSFSNSGYGRNAAVVALAGMAWLSSGSTPGRGP